MSGKLVKRAFVVGVLLASFLIAAAGNAVAGRPDACSEYWAQCYAACDAACKGKFDQASCRENCDADCDNNAQQCITANPKPSNMGPGTTTPPPKGKGFQDTANVGGDKQVGGGTPPKGKGLLDTVNVGPISQPEGGSSSPPKGKLGLGQVNVGGLSSGQTSGDTTTIQRSHSGKKR